MPNGVDNFKIQLGLPQFPPDSIPQELYPHFSDLHRAIQNLLRGVSQYCGIDSQPTDTWSSLNYEETLLTGNLTRMYPVADVAILRGQVIKLFNSGGVLKAGLAQANGLANMAHGVANSSAAPGQVLEVNIGQALLDSIGSLTIGTMYYLASGVAGATQNVAPVAAGQIVQPIGLALGPNTLLMQIPFNPRLL